MSQQHKEFLRRVFHEALLRAAVNENTSVSPLSIFGGLALVVGGAKGETYAELSEVLGSKGVPASTLLPQISGVFNGLTTEQEKGTFTVANNVFVNKNITLINEYVDTVSKLFHSEITTNDAFFADSTNSANVINKWVSDKTQGKITDLIQPTDIGAAAHFVLVNAIHFKAEWELEFNESATIEADFHVTPSQTTKVSLMNRTENTNCEYGEDAVAKWVKLNYDNSSLHAIFVLPQQHGNLHQVGEHFFGSKGLLQRLSETILGNSKEAPKFATQETLMKQVAIPKFKIHSKLRLKELLQTLGIKHAFSGNADFSGIAAGKHFIDEVIHDVHIELNEKGTEATAATAVVARGFAGEPPGLDEGIKSFVATEPFYFIIENDASGIVFAARISNPTL